MIAASVKYYLKSLFCCKAVWSIAPEDVGRIEGTLCTGTKRLLVAKVKCSRY